MYYFAYGSNMSKEQMQRRCPASEPIGKASLTSYKFVYDGYSSKKWSGAVANILYSEGSTVWGRLFEIDKECLANLDKCEGYNKSPKVYDRKELEVRDGSGQNFKAIVYFRIGEKVGSPSQKYQRTVVKGAKECGLPDEYINEYLFKE